MIVRMFKPKFAPKVESGEKKQTVRPRPKRMPKIGQDISLREWTGKPYRSKQRELARSTVTAVASITIHENAIEIDGTLQTFKEDEAFAKADGFGSAREFFQWFRSNHELPLDGIVTCWK